MQQRHVLALMLFGASFCIYIVRLNLSMAVVAMAGYEEPLKNDNSSRQEEICRMSSTSNEARFWLNCLN